MLSPRQSLVLVLTLLVAIGVARVGRQLWPAWPLFRRLPGLTLRGLRHVALSAWAWAILPVRIQLVWPVTLLTVATSPWTSRMWRSIPIPALPAIDDPFRPALDELLAMARVHPFAAAPIAAFAVVGLVHTLWVVGRGGFARRVWELLVRAYTWSDRLTRRLLRIQVTLPLVALAAMLVLAAAEVPALARVAPGGVIGVALLVAWYVGYAVVTARKGRRPRWEGTILVDDVSRMSAAAVDRVVHVLDTDDVVRVVREARVHGRAVSIRGQAHTMGGQTIAAGGWVVDTRFLRTVRWHPDEQLVEAEAGATWGDVIRALNPHGLAPMTMQSYCSFSVGGTLSANAHGITNDLALVASVVRIEVVDGEGRVRLCDREHDAELFSCVIGGYGLFGILVRAWLRAVDNTKLAMQSVAVRPAAFPAAYAPLLDDPTVEVKLARVDATRFDQVHLYVFRRAAPQNTVSDLEATERTMSIASRVLYTWAAPLPLVRRLRYAVEDLLQRPLDWSDQADRNQLMYESARPLARLYGPLVRLDETFVLQEYFVPAGSFGAWMDLAATVLVPTRRRLTLLNVTIRFVRKDETTALPYAQQDVFAFVLYFRLARTPTVEGELAAIHRSLVEGTLRLGGTFYLPYRHHYDQAQLVAAYPMIGRFFGAKRRLDPEGRFSNAWYRAYAPGIVGAPVSDPVARPDLGATEAPGPLPTPELRRTHSFRAMQTDPLLRAKFARFLAHVFPIEDPHRIEAAVAQEVAAGHDDLGVYAGLLRRQVDRPLARWFAARNQVRQVLELRKQNADLLRQIRSTLALVGRPGAIRGLASIGDPGRLVLGLQAMGVQGPVYVLHDKVRPLDPVERGSPWPVGERVTLDYTLVDEVPVPTASVDLAICAMGLHHFPLDRLPAFLAIVRRIVRPGGVFLVREHDARPDLIPILDLAHAVFNAVTGVAPAAEAHEIRAFRPIRDWRRVLAEAGFEDTGLLETDGLDPTEDHLLCFRVPAVVDEAPTDGTRIDRARAALARKGVELKQVEPEFSFFRLPEWLLVDVAQIFGAYMDTIPWYRFPFVRFVGLYWRVLDAEIRAATRLRGPGAIARSQGVLMGVVIGIVATIQLLSMKILALPILGLYGPDTPVEREQLLVEVPSGSLPDLGPGAKVTPAVDDLVLLEVPRHRPFTGIVRRLAQVDGLELLEVSGQQGALQVRVSVDGDAASAAVRSIAGVELVHAFVFPAGDKREQLALAVQIPRLLPFVRAADALAGVRIEQIYDLND